MWAEPEVGLAIRKKNTSILAKIKHSCVIFDVTNYFLLWLIVSIVYSILYKQGFL